MSSSQCSQTRVVTPPGSGWAGPMMRGSAAGNTALPVLCSVCCAVCSRFCVVCSVQRAVCGVQSVVGSVQCAVCSV